MHLQLEDCRKGNGSVGWGVCVLRGGVWGGTIALTYPLYLEAHSRGRDVAAGYRRGKTGSASDGQGLPVPLYQCKTDYFLGQRGHFTFYKPSLLFSWAYINFESRGEAEGVKRKRDGAEKKGKEGQMKSVLGMSETSGFIF